VNDWLKTTWLIAARELRLGARARSFRLVTVLLVVAVAVAMLVPAARRGRETTHAVGVVGSSPAALLTVRTAARILGATVKPVAFADLATAEAGLRDGEVQAVLVPGREVLIARAPYAGITTNASSLEGALALAGGLIGHSGTVATPTPAPSLPIRGLSPPLTGLSVRLTGLAVSIVIYMIIVIYGSRITIGVSEEKQSRVVEVLLAAVRPPQLLLGKVLGLGILALAQALAIVATFLVLGAATSSSLLRNASVDVVAVGAIWIVVGYAFYCTAYAAAGSLVTKPSDASNAAVPVQLPLIASYVLTFAVLYGDSVPAYYWFFAYFPPSAPVSMTVLVAMGAAAPWQVAVSVAISLASTVAMAWAAGRIYGRAILHTGSRLKWRQAWRSRA
jgi:ABC-2 type transport system permease protein